MHVLNSTEQTFFVFWGRCIGFSWTEKIASFRRIIRVDLPIKYEAGCCLVPGGGSLNFSQLIIKCT